MPVQRSDWLAIGTLGLATWLIQVPFLIRDISFYDDGSIPAIVDGPHHGALMYRNHVTPTAPLMYELIRHALVSINDHSR